MLTPPNSPHSEHIPTQPDFKSKLIVVSNRLPITIKRVSAGRYEYNKSSGGLVSGISGLKQDTKFEWYGWPGLSVPADELHQVEKVLKTDYNAVPVSLDDKLADTHYNGFSNSTLWPLLHYQECFSYQQDDWKAYKQVNQLFAERIAADCSDGDTVWVHDYHLLLLPAMLREEAAKLNKTITIGFFLHTPFPASDQFRILPVHRELLHGVLSSDLIGFHTASYAENFNMTCNSVLEPEARFSVFKRLHRPAHVGVYPIGIEPEKFTQELARLECQTRSDLVRARYGDTRIIVGVDRLDYIKGLPRKVQALECFLSRHPEWIGKVTLVQVVVPSRETIPEYKKLWNTLEDLVNGVNQKYSKKHPFTKPSTTTDLHPSSRQRHLPTNPPPPLQRPLHRARRALRRRRRLPHLFNPRRHEPCRLRIHRFTNAAPRRPAAFRVRWRRGANARQLAVQPLGSGRYGRRHCGGAHDGRGGASDES
jgi:trehalose 6-phosphate synthase